VAVGTKHDVVGSERVGSDEEAKVALVPGPDMGGEAYDRWARLNFGTSKEIITEGLERIARIL
jgi:bifunctional pyridoxal-dependent enzyme with beta-cystathionase and maltose regulon repressor activities